MASTSTGDSMTRIFTPGKIRRRLAAGFLTVSIGLSPVLNQAKVRSPAPAFDLLGQLHSDRAVSDLGHVALPLDQERDLDDVVDGGQVGHGAGSDADLDGPFQDGFVDLAFVAELPPGVEQDLDVAFGAFLHQLLEFLGAVHVVGTLRP